MWTPTHVQLTVKRAKGLLFKGKNNTNDAFVTICLGKEKYQTSVKERSADPVEWNEECELPIPKQGNKAEVVLTVLHRNFIGDQFLGTVSIPLSDFDHYEQPKNRWVSLKAKPGPEKNKPRGELEFRLGFTVKSGFSGSYSDLAKKDSLRASFGQLSKKASSVGGSLLSLGGKDKKGGLKGLAKAVGEKVSTLPGRVKKKNKDESFGTIPEQQVFSHSNFKKQNPSEADPGVVSDEEDDFTFEELSHKSSNSSLSVSQVALSTSKDGSLENLGGGEFMSKNKNYSTPPPIKPVKPSRNPHPTDTVPIDEWEEKFFMKPNNSIKLPPGDDLKFSPVTNRKPLSLVEADQPEPEIKPKKDTNIGMDKMQGRDKAEPVPKPRQLLEPKTEMIIKEEKIIEPKKEDKKKEVKEKSKSISKGTIASIFSPKSKEPEENQIPKGTPIGITNPIRQRDSQQSETRLPREVLKKFEGKTRDDLVEMIVRLQNTVEHQKLKMGDMEDYIDNLLVRVMENKPTLLQNRTNGVSENVKLTWRMPPPIVYSQHY